MESRIPENPWPARKVILMTILFGYVMVTVVMAYMYYTRHVGRLAPPFLVSAGGIWNFSDDGLHFRAASGNVEWQIPWGAISRMKYTSVTLVIWWMEPPDESVGRPQRHRDVLYVQKEQADDLIKTWRLQTRTSTPLTHSEHGR